MTDLTEFQKLSPDRKLAMESLTLPLDRILWVLYVAKQDFKKEYLTPTEISNILVSTFEINSTSVSVSHTLARAKTKVHSESVNNVFAHSIMSSGKKYILEKTQIKSGVIYIQPGKPFTGKRTLSTILQRLKGSICICDPYIGTRTLDALKECKASKIRFITHLDNILNSKASFLRDFKDFSNEFPKVQLRDYPSK